ncbi:MAG TPA: L,D-transpeptidase [Nitrospirales bacterium]|nr:L,D-transpeptidase [Nitrospiraceae bacterium]HNP28465.1 L,D-transpeptidase [Nitrospirales bacterium]
MTSYPYRLPRVIFLLSLLVVLTTTLGASPTVTPKRTAPLKLVTTPKIQGEEIPFYPSSPRLLAAAPKGLYLVVDTAQNRVSLRKGNRILYSAVASTGSGARLQDPRNPANGWVFDTPRGVFTISSKIKNPAWNKPDWAFIEEGQPIPTKPKDRIETGVLGDYALGFGNGYFIHGTLYTRMLGTNVTHGCIRLGDEPLKYVFNHVPLGTTLIIF